MSEESRVFLDSLMLSKQTRIERTNREGGDSKSSPSPSSSPASNELPLSFPSHPPIIVIRAFPPLARRRPQATFVSVWSNHERTPCWTTRARPAANARCCCCHRRRAAAAAAASSCHVLSHSPSNRRSSLWSSVRCLPSSLLFAAPSALFPQASHAPPLTTRSRLRARQTRRCPQRVHPLRATSHCHSDLALDELTTTPGACQTHFFAVLSRTQPGCAARIRTRPRRCQQSSSVTDVAATRA